MGEAPEILNEQSALFQFAIWTFGTGIVALSGVVFVLWRELKNERKERHEKDLRMADIFNKIAHDYELSSRDMEEVKRYTNDFAKPTLNRVDENVKRIVENG